MSISEKLTQERLQELLLNIYKKSEENESIKVLELIEDIKHQVLHMK